MRKLICWLFAKLVAPKVRVKFTNEGNAYDNEQEIVYIDTDDCNADNDYGFMRHIKTGHHFKQVYDYSLTVWSILHEIGHYYTLDDCEDDDSDLETRVICALIDTHTASDNPQIQDMYFNLESEYSATEWAIDFIENHKTLCKIFSFLTF